MHMWQALRCCWARAPQLLRQRPPPPGPSKPRLYSGLASLYKTNPEGNSYTAGLDLATAKFLQSVAWQTVQEYAKR